MMRRASARHRWPALALATVVWPAAAKAGAEEDRRVHRILSVQEVSVAAALQNRDFDRLTQAESGIYAEVGPAMRTRAVGESPCVPAARSLAMLAGVSASRLVQEPDPKVARGSEAVADDYARAMAACETAAGVRPSARPPYDIFLKHLDR